MKRNIQGFTLVEIAIVLVVVGLLLGGVLKGGEMITAARVRNLIAQQQGIEAAFLGFQDRYRALPGDYASAGSNINCPVSACVNGDGNGRIEEHSAGGLHERVIAWSHLSAAGLLNGSFTTDGVDDVITDDANPKNPYGVYLQLGYDDAYGGGTSARHNLKTGGHIPVDVLAEIDRKIDDGNPLGGSFQFSAYAPGGTTAPSVTACVDSGAWNIVGQDSNCGATSLF